MREATGSAWFASRSWTRCDGSEAGGRSDGGHHGGPGGADVTPRRVLAAIAATAAGTARTASAGRTARTARQGPETRCPSGPSRRGDRRRRRPDLGTVGGPDRLVRPQEQRGAAVVQAAEARRAGGGRFPAGTRGGRGPGREAATPSWESSW